MGKGKPGKSGPNSYTVSDHKANHGLLEIAPRGSSLDSYHREGRLSVERSEGGGGERRLSCTELNTQSSLQPQGEPDDSSDHDPKSAFVSASGTQISSTESPLRILILKTRTHGCYQSLTFLRIFT